MKTLLFLVVCSYGFSSTYAQAFSSKFYPYQKENNYEVSLINFNEKVVCTYLFDFDNNQHIIKINDISNKTKYVLDISKVYQSTLYFTIREKPNGSIVNVSNEIRSIGSLVGKKVGQGKLTVMQTNHDKKNISNNKVSYFDNWIGHLSYQIIGLNERTASYSSVGYMGSVHKKLR